MKVLLINNYPTDKAFQLWEKGEYPSHYIWGKVELDKNKKIEIIILKHEKYKFLNFIGNLFKIKYLDQQIRTLWIIKKIDIIYAPYATANTTFLILLKLLRLISTPIVITVHQPMFGYNSNSSIKKFVAKKLIPRYDAVVFLSQALREDFIQKLKISPIIVSKKFFHAGWGPDAEFYKNYANQKPVSQTSFVICAGKTDRDFETIIEAFREIDFPLRIYCTPESLPKSKNIPKNITIHSSGISYIELLKEYNKARIILIPLKSHRGGTQGLTSLIDAFAMGKPVIMTYNRNIDIDIEREGIGYWAEQYDILSWRKCINKVLKNEKLLESLGSNSMRIYKENCNAEIFAEALEDVFTRTYINNRNKK